MEGLQFNKIYNMYNNGKFVFSFRKLLNGNIKLIKGGPPCFQFTPKQQENFFKPELKWIDVGEYSSMAELLDTLVEDIPKTLPEGNITQMEYLQTGRKYAMYNDEKLQFYFIKLVNGDLKVLNGPFQGFVFTSENRKQLVRSHMKCFDVDEYPIKSV